MKKYLVALTAFGIVLSAAPEPVMAMSASLAVSDAASYEQTNIKQRRRWNRRGPRWGYRTVCRREWRRGRPQRVCRQVRFRRW